MDVVGIATRHCRRPVVTASVDGVELRDPIRVGEHVALRASVAYTSERSIGIRAAMSSSGPDALPAREVLTAYMTFVGLDEAGKPTLVPQMRAETPAGARRFARVSSGASSDGSWRRGLSEGGPSAPGERAGPTGAGPRAAEDDSGTFDSVGAPGGTARAPDRTSTIEPVLLSDISFHGTHGELMRWLETNAQLSARATWEKGGRMVGLLDSRSCVRCNARLRAHPVDGGPRQCTR
jgi:acyl-CoA hydrolase